MATAEQLVACQQAIREIHVDDKVRQYLMQIVHDTREHDDVRLGASPRASIALFRCSQAMAALRGRNFVQPDDVKRVAEKYLTKAIVTVTAADPKAVELPIEVAPADDSGK